MTVEQLDSSHLKMHVDKCLDNRNSITDNENKFWRFLALCMTLANVLAKQN